MNKKIDIKPCPFCGGEAKVGLIVSTVNCSKCGATAGEYSVGYKAIEAWNKRAENKVLKEDYQGVVKKFDECRGCLARIAEKLNIELPNEAQLPGISEWHESLIFELDKWKP